TRRFHISLREQAAAHEPDAEGPKIAFTAKLEDRGPRLLMSFPRHRHFAGNATVRWKRAGLGYGNHAGQSADALQNFAEEDSLLLGCVVAALRQRRSRNQYVVGSEAKINVLNGKWAAHHQARADQQHNRKRDL